MNSTNLLLVISFLVINNFYAMSNGPEKVVETERLYARQFTLDDAPHLMPILGDKQVMALTLSEPFSLEKIKSLLENHIFPSYKTNGWGRYAVIKKDDNALIGYAGFSVQKLGEEDHVDLGYGFAKEHWKSGYATEIARALAGHADNKMKIPALVALIHPDNDASIRVAKKVGFEFWKECIYHNKPVQAYKIKFKAE